MHTIISATDDFIYIILSCTYRGVGSNKKSGGGEHTNRRRIGWPLLLAAPLTGFGCMLPQKILRF